ncbi:GSU2403 family nucleotidyltransferase fold protein [Rhizobium sp. ZPR3]|uniref:GSU2403 family nucleotidyltransferase fold protein n=2 Tax=unclassified Rhizobium TaxID=2613769 RepID=A0AAU7SA80_9HYPH
MNRLDTMYQTILAELGQRVFDASFVSDFPADGRFVSVTVKDRKYWYFDQPDGQGGQTRRYVGPADDAAITERVTQFKALKNDFTSRRKLVRTLIREGGLPRPENRAGDIIEVLANAGFFRLRGVLIGTVAYQCYSGLLGVRLPSASMVTGDADLAQDFAISNEVQDSLPPILDLLRSVDETFQPIPPHGSGSPRSSAFRTQDAYRVEFLTGNRGSDDYLDKPAEMPALGGASADPLRFLDFLIYEPVRTVLLHQAGVSVLVPDPARYAIHKLIVATRRIKTADSFLKQQKDLDQATALIEAMAQVRRFNDMREALQEAWARGPAWREAITEALSMIPNETANRLVKVIDENDGG